MTVKELIEKLSVLNPDSIVEIEYEYEEPCGTCYGTGYKDVLDVIDLETRVVIQ